MEENVPGNIPDNIVGRFSNSAPESRMMPLNNPLVSVIIPTHNGERYLPAAIESCLAQTYGTIEIIVVDDGSEDGTRGLARKYRDRDGRVFMIRKKNGGPASARNAGLEHATGEYVCFLDDDDVFETTKIEEQLNFMQANGHIITLHHFATYDHALSKKLVNVRSPDFLMDPESNIERLFTCGGSFSPCALMARRDIFESIRFNETYPCNEDEEIAYRILEKYRVHVLDRCLFRRRMKPGNRVGGFGPVYYSTKMRLTAETCARYPFLAEYRMMKLSALYLDMALFQLRNGRKKEAFAYLKRSMSNSRFSRSRAYFNKASMTLVSHLLLPFPTRCVNSALYSLECLTARIRSPT